MRVEVSLECVNCKMEMNYRGVCVYGEYIGLLFECPICDRQIQYDLRFYNKKPLLESSRLYCCKCNKYFSLKNAECDTCGYRVRVYETVKKEKR